MMKSGCIYIKKGRLPWLDIAKAIAMIAVVFSHEFASVKPLVLLCNSFMLPLFFICSGFCLSPGKYKTSIYIKRKAKTLLLPYLGLGIIVSLLHVCIDGYDKVMNNVFSELFSWQTLWFLPVLFMADVIMYVCLTRWGSDKYKLLTIGIISLFIGISLAWIGISLPLNLDAVPISIFYLSVGYTVRTKMKEERMLYHSAFGSVLLTLGIILMGMTRGNLILKLNDILPMTKILFSVMENVGMMFLLRSVITPPFWKNSKCRFNYWNILEKTQWSYLHSICPYSFIAKSY